MASYDVVGNIVIYKFSRKTTKKEKLKVAKAFLEKNVHVSTFLEKTSKIKGRLRTPETRYILGNKTKEAVYRENGCTFRLNVDTCYFSPRLAGERKEIADITNNGEKVMVMFGGVAPFAVVIAKTKRPSRVVSVELNRACQPYALDNVKENKVNVEIVQGDVRKVCSKTKDKFDRVVMARPNLKDSFLDAAFKVIRPKGTIHYYGFYEEDKKEELLELIKGEAKKARKKIKILGIKKAGDIGVRKFRYRVDFKII
jgi:tRNA (guanine37-N1)-methyltransferase